MKKVTTTQDAIDKYLFKQQEPDRVRSGRWSPSSFGRCFRYQCLNRANVIPSNPPDSRSLRVFKVGHMFHGFVQDIVKGEGVEIEKEVDYKDIFGYADYVDKDIVKDYKSQHSNAFWHMNKKDADILKDKLPNWMQVATYARILKRKKCGIAFISKDDLCIAEFEMDADYFFPFLDEEIKTLREYWGNKILPPAEARAYKGKECSYCQFKKHCKELGKDKNTLPEPRNVRGADEPTTK